ncbi:PIG-L family deacetylase [Pseudovibrio sp. Ad26]|uniref:PIG-L deacetylase family protein n=1 Tax=Pseudovibrio sp. Ad26 TaxID=989410 RepID=UPI0007B25AEE|nr:PIG-L family deacetylase [Pseudovibrio sp. Ad26]KZL05064.1 2'-N-acetylparomamine deacetylase [Pseudovibrio sp. Ad26]
MRSSKVVIISPHLDDAVFSAGGALLDRRFSDVTVVSVFTKSRYRINGCGNWRNVTHERLIEDVRALSLLGVKSFHLGLEDASLRQGYTNEAAYLSTKLVPNNDPIWDQAVMSISNIIHTFENIRVILPLGIGGHIDHLIARDAALLAIKHQKFIWFYKDATYDRTEEQIQRIVKSMNISRECIFTPSSLDKKEEIVNIYTSQVNKKVLDSIRGDLHRYHGERFWIRNVS